MRLFLHNLGCPKNQIEGELIRGWGEIRGLQLTENASRADVIVVNTCAFIREAQEEAIAAILEAARLKTVGACQKLFVYGCFPQRFREELPAELPEVDGFFGVGQWRELLDEIKPNGNAGGGANPYLYRHLETPDHYAYLRIADGCNRGCSYCVIPAIRGPYRSRPLDEILAEAKDLVKRGVKELLPVAQELNSYGHDLGLGQGNQPLISLLGQLADIDELEWIRPLYLHPPACDEELLSFWAAQPKMCHYLDLPIEHASDRLLRAMGRGGNQQQLWKLIAAARTLMPDVVLRTSVIVGFPGETEAEFQELLDFIQEIRFPRLGSFLFSPEAGTPAARSPRQVPSRIKHERRERLMELQHDIALEFNRTRLGTTAEVFVDRFEAESGFSVAHGRQELPDLDGEILISGSFPVGQKLTVVFTEILEYDLLAQPVS